MLNRKILLLFSIITNYEAFVDDNNYPNNRTNYVYIENTPTVETHVIHTAPQQSIVHHYDSNNYTRNNNPPSTVVVTKSDNNGFFIFGALVALVIVVGLVANNQGNKTTTTTTTTTTQSDEDFVEKVVKGHKTEVLDYRNDNYLGHGNTICPNCYVLKTESLSKEIFQKILEKITIKSESFTDKTSKPAKNILITFSDRNFTSLLSDNNIKQLITNLNSKISVSMELTGTNYNQTEINNYLAPIVKDLIYNSKYMLLICHNDYVLNILNNNIIHPKLVIIKK
jgi:hypothetical protein